MDDWRSYFVRPQSDLAPRHIDTDHARRNSAGPDTRSIAMARVITARRADTCRECSKAIKPGDQINYGGPGAVSCVTCRPLQSVRTRYGRRTYGGQSYTGARCEDAPCCGCC